MRRALSLFTLGLATTTCTSLNVDRLPPADGSADSSDADATPTGVDNPPPVGCADASCQKVRPPWDATGDGRGDLITVRHDGMYVAASTGSAFSTPARWISADLIK